MPRLKCVVEKCCYNKKHSCCRAAIDVEGIGSRTKADTECLSYLPRTSDSLLEEISEEFMTVTNNTNIYCDVINCVFERNSRCHADIIEIKNVEKSDMVNMEGFWKVSDTMCKTFESKD